MVEFNRCIRIEQAHWSVGRNVLQETYSQLTGGTELTATWLAYSHAITGRDPQHIRGNSARGQSCYSLASGLSHGLWPKIT
jgi:hypothetical protein